MKLDREGNFVLVGTYDLGNEVVGLLAEIGATGGHWCYGDAGSKTAHSKVHNMPYMVIGIDHTRWAQVMEVLLHEMMELSFDRLDGRFKNAAWWCRSHANYTFMFNHEVFAEACARSSLFIATCQLDLCRIFKHVRANRTKFRLK